VAPAGSNQTVQDRKWVWLGVAVA